MASQFQQRVQCFIEQEHLFIKGDSLLVALSGGADSVALLTVMQRLGYRCIAAHCNFHLRGNESNRDEQFCRDLCQKMEVQLHVNHFDTQKYARMKGISIEMAARELRYEWFESLCREFGYTYIAVAHHRDDSAETLLLNLVRGTGIAGLTGIHPVNGRVVRPLLCVSRMDVLSYLRLLKQEYVTDSTNLHDDYLRNKIRLHLLPLMQQMNPSITESLANTADRIRSAEVIYRQSIEQTLSRVTSNNGRTISIAQLLAEAEPRTILFEALRPYGFVDSQVMDIFRTLNAESGRRFANAKWQVLKDRDTLQVRPIETKSLDEVEVISLPTELVWSNGTVLQFKKRLLLPGENVPKDSSIAFLDAAHIQMPLRLRTWRKGEKFAPLGMKGRKKLISDFLTDLKLSIFQKEEQLLLTDAEDKVLWVVGRRIDERVKVTPDTIEVIEVNSHPR